MSIVLDGTSGITTPEIVSTGGPLVVNASAPDNSVVVDASGNVGIGTGSPKSDDGGNKLEISNNANTVVTLTATNDTTPLFNFRSNAVDRLSIQSSSNFGANFLVRSNQDMRFGTNNTERMRIDSSGNLLVGTTSSNPVANSVDGVQFGDGRIRVSKTDRTPLELQRRTTNGIIVEFRRDNTTPGSISVTTTNTTYSTSSDYRLKHDIQPMTGALARVAALKPVTYKWNVDNSEDEGFIAHELAEVCPSAVTGEKDAVNEDGSIKSQGIDTSFLVATLAAALQELKAINDAQAQTIESLTARVAALEQA